MGFLFEMLTESCLMEFQMVVLLSIVYGTARDTDACKLHTLSR